MKTVGKQFVLEKSHKTVANYKGPEKNNSQIHGQDYHPDRQ